LSSSYEERLSGRRRRPRVRPDRRVRLARLRVRPQGGARGREGLLRRDRHRGRDPREHPRGIAARRGSAHDAGSLRPVPLGVDGLSAELEFYKGLLDKVGVQYDGVAIGEFKSAPEHYKNTKMSDHYREEYSAMIDGIYDHYVQGVASSRKLPVDKVNQLIDN